MSDSGREQLPSYPWPPNTLCNRCGEISNGHYGPELRCKIGGETTFMPVYSVNHVARSENCGNCGRTKDKHLVLEGMILCREHAAAEFQSVALSNGVPLITERELYAMAFPFIEAAVSHREDLTGGFLLSGMSRFLSEAELVVLAKKLTAVTGWQCGDPLPPNRENNDQTGS